LTDRPKSVRRVEPLPARSPRSVTVVVPCFNYGHFLPQAVQSALDQVGVSVDVIIIDDASTDDSALVAQRLSEGEPRVCVIRHSRNRGHISTYNEGLAQATGEYVALLSADDVLPPGALDRSTALMEAFPSVGLVYGECRSFSGAPPQAELVHPLAWTVYPGHLWLQRVSRTAWNPIANPEVVMRRAAWETSGPYDALLPHCADFALWLATATEWDIGRVEGTVQGYYREHDSAMHVDSGAFRDLRERRLTFERVLVERGGSRADLRQLNCIARRALARHALRLARGIGWWELGPPPADSLRRFARAAWPGVTRSPLWWLPAWVRDLPPPTATRPAATLPVNALYERARFKVNGVRWRV
jgi:glycosyltransferase involved in cell wall biosynthesis